MEMRVMAPFLGWGVAVTIILGVTIHLQQLASGNLGPKRAVLLEAYDTMAVGFYSLELVSRVQGAAAGLWAMEEGEEAYLRGQLTEHAKAMRDAQVTLMFGTEALPEGQFDGVEVRPGTVFRTPGIRALHFGDRW